MKYNKGIGVIGIILIIVGVLVVGGGAYYLGSNNPKLEDDWKGMQENLEDQNNLDDLSSVNIINSEDATDEVFEGQPGEIKSIKSNGANSWILEVDLLSFNPDWYPESDDSRYTNQNTKVRSLIVNKDTLIKDCRDPNYSLCSNYKDFSFIKENFNNSHIFHFDITGTIINAIYEPYVS